MSRRPAIVTQADLTRAIRAAHAAGLKVVRIVTRNDGVAIETASETDPGAAAPSNELDLELAEFEARHQ